MEILFDIRGNLTPYRRIEITLDEFQKYFVDSFDLDSTRTKIFENYIFFLENFQREITPNFTQWIDGSFISNKKNPNDIDFITLIDHETYAQKRELINDKFRLKGAKEIYQVDAYTVEVFPEGHKEYLICKSNLVYWDNWFWSTKRDKRKRKHNKGYIEIKFENK